MSLRTLHRRVREVAKCAADAEQVVADFRQAITDLPDGAVVLPRTRPHQPAAVGSSRAPASGS
jgi:hypothetical protein